MIIFIPAVLITMILVAINLVSRHPVCPRAPRPDSCLRRRGSDFALAASRTLVTFGGALSDVSGTLFFAALYGTCDFFHSCLASLFNPLLSRR